MLSGSRESGEVFVYAWRWMFMKRSGEMGVFKRGNKVKGFSLRYDAILKTVGLVSF